MLNAYSFPAESLIEPGKGPFYDEESILFEFLERFKHKNLKEIVREAYFLQLEQRDLTNMVLVLHDALTMQPFCELVALCPMNSDLTRAVLEFSQLLSMEASLTSLLVSTMEIERDEQWNLVCKARDFSGLVWLKKLPKLKEVEVQHGSLRWTFQYHTVSTRYKGCNLYERREERLLWLSVFFAMARRNPSVLVDAPMQLVVATALLPF